MRKRVYDIGWSDDEKCQRKRYGEAQVVPLSISEGRQTPDVTGFGEREQRATTWKEDWKWHRSTTAPCE